jgi:predicted nicotinamide N-methyase
VEVGAYDDERAAAAAGALALRRRGEVGPLSAVADLESVAAAAPGLRAFGRPLTARRPPLCPEIELWLVDGDVDLESDCRHLDECQPPPYWAFCWASGQALARYLLDRPADVRNRRVVDFGSGCGVAAIAAALAGADEVVAVDLDPAAREAVVENALRNGVRVAVSSEIPAEWDVLLAADVLYEGPNLERLMALRAAGRCVLVSDPGRASSPALPVAPVARYAARTLPDVDSPLRSAAVYRLPART